MSDESFARPREPKQRPSADAYQLANLSSCLSAVAVALQEVARRLERLEGDERRELASQLERQLGEIGDLGHEARRLVRAVLVG